MNKRITHLRLELDVGVVARLLVLRHARVAELEEHLAPQDPARVHIRHRHDVLCRTTRQYSRFVQDTAARYPPLSSGRPRRYTRFSPSIVVETLFPRNLDFGRSSPITATLFAGET